MDISTQTLKNLRAQTGAGMADCQKALKAAAGDIKKAIELLRKKGIAKAAKRGGREACEGIALNAVNKENNEGYMVEVNAETDFVVRSDEFRAFAGRILEIISREKPADLEELLSEKMDNDTVQNKLESLSGIIGEKIAINRFAILKSSGTVAAYSHMGGKIGVLAALDKPGEKELAYDLAMHIAAAKPEYIDVKDVPAEKIEKEKEIYKEQLLKAAKPENIIEKIIEGKISKYYEEVVLTRQEFIKDDKKKIRDILNGAVIENYIRYSLAQAG